MPKGFPFRIAPARALRALICDQPRALFLSQA